MSITEDRFSSLALNLDQVFLLNPSNADYLTGKSPAPELRPTVSESGQVFFRGFILLAVGVIVLISLVKNPSAPAVMLIRLLIAILVVVGGFYALLIGYEIRQFRARRKAAAHTAKLIAGKVVSCSAYEAARSGHVYKVLLSYQYQTPDSGALVLAQESAIRNDIDPEKLPVPGTPVIVVTYDPPLPLSGVLSHRFKQNPVL